ncbi:TPA: DUF3631 domain-containing protein [Pseudomonas aeruginosa]|uniref:DUF3631 domain-containing protein n=9 Tax=Gammaproteobacteria TaxID=1236 RepID=A0A9P1R1W7_PSEAI|nr:DUF3631 domain-containing protein [Pseudomonas aeruginosa]ABR84149.1 hypothetical protein PSPA7_0362 [Pseudomonas aeruginosa PA7]AKE66959.1 hypothetical protein YQ19_01735 [Pseudomonas aeruginosa]ARG53981.1 hypothetical protein BFV99_32920 [Pseudomonas aeruginosa]EIU2680986.1 DUF3631 domain-containing protein [Pseudomonas aeruginosa]EIU3424588.1 DUF3631 domain-containing protein [Pseudomonas aeruginosa]
MAVKKDPYGDQWAGSDTLNDAIKKLGTDAGALYETKALAQLKKMRGSDPAAFARLRAKVKDSKMLSMAEFDRLTIPAEDEEVAAGGDIFTEVEAWPKPVKGDELLDEICAVLRRYVAADKETIRAAALWSTFTWLIDVVQVAPIANITAPEKRCGKSILLTALGKLAYRPMQVSNIAPAALYRAIELWSPTLLIDEVDAFLAAYDDARGILNAGFTRDSASVIRCVGDDHMPTRFNVWGAKALCGIGKIADTLADRSIPLRLRRRVAGEKVERLRHSDPVMWERLQAKLARWTADNAVTVGDARPAPIQGLNDRANDCWEPLLAIAEAAGGHWPKSARQAAIVLHGLEGEAPSIGAELLQDVKAVFEDKNITKIFSGELLDALLSDDESPWATWNRGKPISTRQLSGKLGDFGIKSKQIRIGSDSKKGYEIKDFLDAFNRYLSANPPSASETSKQTSNHAASSDFSNETLGDGVSDKKTLQPSNHAGCFDVSDKTPPPGRKGGKKGATSQVSYEEVRG